MVSVGAMGYYLASSSMATTNPLAGHTFYLDPTTQPVIAYNNTKLTNPADADQIAKIATYPVAAWVGGWIANPHDWANKLVGTATAKNQLATIVTYNIPGRDCGSHSAGGLASHEAYRAWIDNLAAGIGQRKAIIVIEPDAIPQLDCLDAAGKTARLESLKYSIEKFKYTTQATVYLDAGNARWIAADETANRLKAGGIATADGFALNVSNYLTTSDNVTFGTNVSNLTGGKHFIVDSSRNGLGPDSAYNWCNPSGRALGTPPTTNTGYALVDAFMWIKTPGESDGVCNGGPSAGTWWQEYALGLAQRSTVQPATATSPPPPPSPAVYPAGVHNDEVFTYTGSWTKGVNGSVGENKYMADDHYSLETNATYSLSFKGTVAKVFATKDPRHGQAAIKIDNGPETIIDLYAATRADQQLVYTTPILASGSHIVTIRVVGAKTTASSGTYINADKIEILDSATTIVQGNGDANGDNRVNALDLSMLLSNDGKTNSAVDFNKDGIVGAADMAILLSKWTW